MRSCKPKIIEAGKCYRLYEFAGSGFATRRAGEMIVYVYAIEGDKQRWVRMRSIIDYELGYNADSYTSFLRKVHSEAPAAKN